MRLLLTLTLVSSAAQAWEAPKAEDYIMMGTALSLGALDAWTSADIEGHRGLSCAISGCKTYPDRSEGNPVIKALLGARPTPAEFFMLYGMGALASTGLWLALPARVRWVVPFTVGIVEGAMVYHNLQMGLSLHF